MKKLIKILVICISVLSMCACNDLSLPENVKTEFKLGESALIDQYNITLTEINNNDVYNNKTSKNGQYIVLTFKIKNDSNQPDILESNNFVITIDNQEYYAVENKNVSLNANETIEYNIVFDVQKKSEYDLLFYSGIVTNNIKFKIEI